MYGFISALFCLWLFFMTAWIHGTILGFKKAWYVGLICILIPIFAETIALSNWIGADLLRVDNA